jgi:hypothetical protein
MSWISDIGNSLSGVVTTAEGAVTTTAEAAHTLLGSGGTLTVGNVSIGTGVTQGDVTTANTNVTGALNTNAFSGIITELTSNPIILIGIIALILILVLKK